LKDIGKASAEKMKFNTGFWLVQDGVNVDIDPKLIEIEIVMAKAD
jgi:hypothetical protein